MSTASLSKTRDETALTALPMLSLITALTALIQQAKVNISTNTSPDEWLAVMLH